MIGRVGADEFGRNLIRDLSLAEVDTSGLRVVDEPTGVALIITDAAGENVIVVAPGANQLLDAAAIDEVMPTMTCVTHVLAQLETSISGVVRAAQVARDLRAVFILDPAPARPLPPELLALTDWITPNEQEAKSLLGWTSGPFDPFDAVRALQARGPRNVILKMSSNGAILLRSRWRPNSHSRDAGVGSRQYGRGGHIQRRIRGSACGRPRTRSGGGICRYRRSAVGHQAGRSGIHARENRHRCNARRGAPAMSAGSGEKRPLRSRT